MSKRFAKHITISRVILLVIWVISFVTITFSYLFLNINSSLTQNQKAFFFLLIQIASGFFFPLSIGKIIQWLRDRDIATVIWDYISSFGDSGLVRFYGSRDGEAATDLEKSFAEHEKGDILLTGPSLRLFFSPGTYFYAVILRNLLNYERLGVNIRIVNAHTSKNISLPIRSFVEEFNPDGEHPKGLSRGKLPWKDDKFDWTVNGGFTTLDKFYDDFYNKYGLLDSSRGNCRCLSDLKSVEAGIRELNTKTQKQVIYQRNTICEPYFTAVIFPDKCYYTPNLLNSTPPANMPMLVFHRGGPVYYKILEHYRFLWWSAEPIGRQDIKDE